MANRTSKAKVGNGGRGGVPRDRLLTIGEVAELAGTSKSTIRRMVAAGSLPKPQNLGLPQLHRFHPLRIREALGIDDLPEASE